MLAKKQSARLWVSEGVGEAESSTMLYALAIATAITLLFIMCFNWIPVQHTLQQLKKITQVKLVREEPVPVVEPPAEPKKQVEKVVKQAQPVANNLPVAQANVSSAAPNLTPTEVSAPITNDVATPLAATSLAVSAEAKVPATTATQAAAQPTKPALHAGSIEIGVVCATQVKPILPHRVVVENISGKVTARITIRGSRVIAVDIVKASPKGIFEVAVRNAIMQYQCSADGSEEVVAEQSFDLGG